MFCKVRSALFDKSEWRRFVRKLGPRERYILKNTKYKNPQLVESGLLWVDDWPPEEVKGEFLAWSDEDLNLVQPDQDGLPLFLNRKYVRLFNVLMERECSLEELRRMSSEEKMVSVVGAMLEIKDYIDKTL